MELAEGQMPATKQQAMDLLMPWFRDKRPVSYALSYPQLKLEAYGLISVLTESEIEITSGGRQDAGNHILTVNLADATYGYTDLREMPEEERVCVECGIVIMVPVGNLNVATPEEAHSVPIALELSIWSFTEEGEKKLTSELPDD